MAHGARQPGDGAVRRGPGRVRQDVRLVSGDQSLDVGGTHRRPARRRTEPGSDRRARAQRRSAAARDAAAAEPRPHRQADRRRDDHRLDRGADRRRPASRSTTAASRPTSTSRSIAERRLHGHARRHRRDAAAVADRVDHREGHGADVACSRPSPSGAHVEATPATQVDLHDHVDAHRTSRSSRASRPR